MLLVSFALRALLVFRGGQQFWPDEDRFDRVRTAANALLDDGPLAAAKSTFEAADHVLFRICALLPAISERELHTGPWLAGLFFAAVSTATLWAVGRLAVAAGGSPRERFFAVLAAACTTSLFYYSRHFFPYDLSLLFFLLALALVLNPKRTIGLGFGAGLLTACGFLAYNGYWSLVVAVGGLFVATAVGARTQLLPTGAFCAGVVLPQAAAFAVAQGLGFDMAASYANFAKTAVLGDLGQGWRFIGEYAWQTEGLNVLLMLGALAATWALALRGRAPMGAMYAAMIAMVLYGLLVLASDMLLRLPIPARQARVLLPFVAWLVGAILAWTFERGRVGRRAALAASAFMALVAAWNFREPLLQVFPRNFPDAARAEILKRRNAGEGLQPLRFINDGFLHNPDFVQAVPPDARVLWSSPHPFDYVPYLFEGYDESRRTRYLNRDRSMKVLRFEGARPLKGYPYAFSMAFRMNHGPDERVPRSEPVLGSGEYGDGDLIFLTYPSEGMARVGLDHWGAASPTSAPFRFALDQEHTIAVIAPCLVSVNSPNPAVRHRAEAWLHRVWVSIDGTVVLDVRADMYPAQAATVTVGLNLIHAQTAVTSMSLASARFGPLGEADWARAEREPVAARP